MRECLDYAIDTLMEVQERLTIEHPVGPRPNGGYWTAYEVVQDMKQAFYFENPEFGEMGKNIMRVF